MTVAVPSFTGQGAAVCQGVGLTFRPLSTPPPWRTLPPGSRCSSTQRPGVNFFYLQCPCLCSVVFVSETLQHSNTPTLQHSNTPTLQHSNTPTLQHSNTSPLPLPKKSQCFVFMVFCYNFGDVIINKLINTF